jgi:hypothetical protein
MTGVAGTADFRERRKIGALDWRSIMRHTSHLSALVALFLSGAAAFAQGNGTVAPAVPQNTGSAGISSAPGGSSTTATGMGTGARTNPNAGNRTTGRAGSAGRSASASPRLPGDNPANPGLSAIGSH